MHTYTHEQAPHCIKKLPAPLCSRQIVRAHTVKAHMGIGGIAPLFLALSFTIGKETRYTEEKAVQKEKNLFPYRDSNSVPSTP